MQIQTPSQNVVNLSLEQIERLLEEVFGGYDDEELPQTDKALSFELGEFLYDYLRQTDLTEVDWELVGIIYALAPDLTEDCWLKALHSVRFSFCDTIEAATRPIWNEGEEVWDKRVIAYFDNRVMPDWAKMEAIAEFCE